MSPRDVDLYLGKMVLAADAGLYVLHSHTDFEVLRPFFGTFCVSALVGL